MAEDENTGQPEKEKEVRSLNVQDSINHALFVSQSMMEILIEKCIITKEEVEEKYAQYLRGLVDYQAKQFADQDPDAEKVTETSAEEMFSNFLKEGEF